jgi:YaiO family outer membrane protein
MVMRPLTGRTTVVLLLLLGAAHASLDQAREHLDSDALFLQARELARAGGREEARQLCRSILDRHPEYHDARVLLARLHAWDRDYPVAREQLILVLEQRPTHLDARRALIDIELWSDRHEEALRLCDEGLARHPQEATLHLRRARALSALDRVEEAEQAAWRALELDPSIAGAEEYHQRLELAAQRNAVSLDWAHERFNQGRDPWRDLSVQYRHRFDPATVIARINRSARFGRTAWQYELDSYPKVGERFYAYLNLGLSSSRIFPDWRLGAEIYWNLPHGYELSLGARHLAFAKTDVTLYTGSMGFYRGNYYISIRPFLADKAAGTSTSAMVLVRRYYGDRYSYVAGFAGAGSTPDADLVSKELRRLDSWKLGVEAQRRIHRYWTVKGRLGFRDEEYRTGRNRRSWRVGLGVGRFF